MAGKIEENSMYTISDIREKNDFSWNSIGNIVDGRENLGSDMPVIAYRLFQYTVKAELAKRLGSKMTIEIYRAAGTIAGKEFAKNVLKLDLLFDEFIVHLQNVLKEFKMGILRIEKFDMETGRAIMTVDEDVDCSGHAVTGETVCNYDEGFLAGILNEYTKREYVVTEVDCWATGARTCRFEAHVIHN